MAVNIKDFVLQTLGDPKILRINFGYAHLTVYPRGFRQVAQLVDRGHIRFELSQSNSNYEADTQRGQVHTMRFASHVAERHADGRIVVRKGAGPNQRRTVIHECCHAMHDYNRISTLRANENLPQLRASEFEGAAGIAGWMAFYLWGGRRQARSYDSGSRFSSVHTMEVARRLIDRSIVYTVPPSFIQAINSTAHTGSASRYVFNGV